jgi:hypothetical protein
MAAVPLDSRPSRSWWGRSPETLEDVYEPYLIQEGFLKRTARGREATDLAFTHLGLPPRTGKGAGLVADDHRARRAPCSSFPRRKVRPALVRLAWRGLLGRPWRGRSWRARLARPV